MQLGARRWFLVLLLCTILLGLAVHWHGTILPPAARDALGDALWAMTIAWGIAAAAPRVRLSTRTMLALGICLAVELGQLYHAPGIDALRRTGLGHLLLGSDFDARDLVAYACGVGGAALLERTALRRKQKSNGGTARWTP